MTIFLNNMKRLFRKKLNLIFLVAVPAAAILMAMALNTSGNNIPTVGIVDHDKTEYTKMLIDNLQGKCNVLIIKKDEIQSRLMGSSIYHAFEIKKGFTDGILKSSDEKIKSYRLQDANMTMSVKFAIDSFVSASRTIAKAAGGDSAKFYKGMKAYESGSIKVVEKGFTDTRDKIAQTNAVIGFLVMSMLFLASLSTQTLLDDKKNRTFYRVAAAPVTTRGFMLQNTLSYYAILVVQVLLIIAVMGRVFHFYLGPNPIYIIILLLVFSTVCVSLGVAITTISKDTRQAGTIMSLIITPACMLGGCWWPREFMPEWILKISDFVPTTWIVKSVNEVLNGSNLLSVSGDLVVMVLFAIVLFLLGSWRKTDVAC